MDPVRSIRVSELDAVRQRRAELRESLDALEQALASPAVGRPLIWGERVRSVLAETADGVRSAPEAELRDLIKKAGLPMPLFNPRLCLPDGTFIACPDAWWPEAGVAVEIDSKRWHLSPDDWEHTMDRHDQLSQYAIATLHFTPHKLRTDQAFVIAKLKNAYKSGIARPRLDIKAIPAAS